MAEISTINGIKINISDEDFDVLSGYRWNLSSSKKKLYAYAWVKDISGKSRKCYMHRLIVAPRKGEQVDHIDGDSLNNRRENLRLCTRFENAHNRRQNQDKLYKGVRKSGGIYRMTISKSFATPEEAAANYNKIAKILFGEFAYLNEVEND